MNPRLIIVALLLAGPAAAGPRTAAHGDPLPDGAIARFGTLRFRVGSEQARYSFALSPDGKFLAVESADGIRLWDTETGRVAKHLPWRTSQGDLPKFALAFSPDGKRLARMAGRVVAVWDLATAEEVFDVDFKEEGKFQWLGWLPGKARLVVINERGSRAYLLDAANGKVVRTHTLTATFRQLETTGRWLLGWTGADWHVVDAETGEARGTFEAATPSIGESFDVTPDGKEAIQLGADGVVRRFDFATGKKTAEVPAPDGWRENARGTHMILGPDGAVAYGTQGGAVYRFDRAAGKWLPPIDAPAGRLIPHPDGKRLLVLATDGLLRRYDLATRKELPEAEGFEGEVTALPSPAGDRLAITFGRGRTRLQVVDPAGKVQWADGPFDCASVAAWSPDGRRLAVTDRTVIHIRSADSGKRLGTLKVPEGFDELAGPIRFTTDGRLVAVLDGGARVAVFPPDGMGASGLLPGVTGAGDISPDGGRIVYADGQRGWRLFDTAAGKFLSDWTDPADAAGRPGFTTDGAYLITWELEPQREPWRSRDAVAVLRDPRTGESRKTIGLGVSPPFQWACSPDGLWLAVGDGPKGPLLFDLATGTALGSWAGHRDRITGIHFAGPGRIVTASADLTALLWDVRPTKPVAAPWEALAGDDPQRAWQAVWTLAADPRAPELLRTKITAASPPPADKVTQWIANLGADRFPVREAATKELQALGRVIEPDLIAARDRTRSEEVRTRIDGLLARMVRDRSRSEWVAARAVAALEAAGTPAAKKLLAEWAAGAPGAQLTTDAKAALGRLAGR
jgi:WD40 repeat protein